MKMRRGALRRKHKSAPTKLLALGLLSSSPLQATADALYEAPDVETASERYKRRFSGGAGTWFLRYQASSLLSVLAPWAGGSVLDIGGGHGQYTEDLIQRNYTVTVLGSSPVANEQIRPLLDSGRCRYRVGNLLELPFANQSFDVVISFRLLTHLHDWRRFIGEATRIARRAVIIDFPVWQSFNALYPLLFRLKYATEGHTTRPFEVFKEHEVIAEFREAGFVPTARVAQYFFPMVAHRALHAPSVSIKMEQACHSLGLTRRFGSPVILRVEPIGCQATPGNRA